MICSAAPMRAQVTPAAEHGDQPLQAGVGLRADRGDPRQQAEDRLGHRLQITMVLYSLAAVLAPGPGAA